MFTEVIKMHNITAFDKEEENFLYALVNFCDGTPCAECCFDEVCRECFKMDYGLSNLLCDMIEKVNS